MKKENLVEVFHNTFSHPISSKPKLISENRLEKRISWIMEEIQELRDALKSKDIVECLDALEDIQYFLSGTVVEFGMQDIFDKAFEEVHRSNMSKSCQTEDEAIYTQDVLDPSGKETTRIKVGDRWIIKRLSDGKILKSSWWSTPNLKKIIDDSQAK